jgi:hypothetical protein
MGDFVQFKTGSIDNAASATITFDDLTEAGNTIIIIGGSGLNAPTGAVGFGEPTGGAGSFSEKPWTGQDSQTARVKIEAWAQKNVAGGETTYTFPAAAGTNTGIWVAMEVTGLWEGVPVNITTLEPTFYGSLCTPASDAVGQVTSVSTPAVPSASDTLETTRFFKALGISAFLANEPSSTQPVISGYSTDQNELTQVSATFAAGHSLTLAVTYRKHYDLGRFTASASVSPDAYFTATELVWADFDSRHAPIFDVFTGFEMGTATGLASGSAAVAGMAPFDVVTGGDPAFDSTIKRSGSFSMKLTATAAAKWVAWTDPGVLGVFRPNVASQPVSYALTRQTCVYFDGSLPSTDVELVSIEAGSASNSVKIWYRSASQKIGMRIGSGTEQLSDAVVSANKWIQIPWRYFSFSTTHTLDWAVRYDSLDPASLPVTQAQATATGMTSGPVTAIVFGWKTATTATVYYDDDFVCKQWAVHPLADHHVSPLLVDPTGTVTITGTQANFETYSGASSTAWNAVTARNSIDDMPPTFTDGITQVANAAGDYVIIPMATLALGQSMSPRAVRWYAAVGAVSGTAATLGVRCADGSTVLFTSTVADHGQDSANAVWLCGMARLANNGNFARLWALTVARLAALTFEFGRSGDASPDVRLEAVLAEVAWVSSVEFVAHEAVDDIGGTHRVVQRLDPDTGACLGFLVTTPNNGRGATLSWTANGTPDSLHVATNSTGTVDLNHDAVSQLTATNLNYDPA